MSIRQFSLPLIASIVLLGTSPAYAQAQAGSSASLASNQQLIEGEFVRSTYLEALRRTHSPYASFKQGRGGVMTIRVEKRDGNTGFAFEWNFHEGDVFRHLSRDGQFIIYEEDKDYLGPTRIQITSSESFTLSGDKDVAGRFDRMPDFQNFLNRQTVAGTYQDQKGNRYVFKPEGVAVFPDREFKYAIGTDHIGAPYDWIRAGSETWGYKISGAKLSFFRESDRDSNKFLSRPFLRLSRIGN
ncbi:hypothetical protein VVD49_17560 [Uliginosibacterium sp. H3]|uniref:Outer membrane lipoprotein-sorting protein n=1 Tax=Uliginosibacterium silvisoli TaxID=3114758 RepID=A0ABU6K6N1_9RHOO|nr:hypothetical protein [Uliginosibacterium sp. H3]